MGLFGDFTLAFTTMATNLELVDKEWRTSEQKSWNFPFDDTIVWKKWKESYNPWMTLEPLITREEIELLNNAIMGNDIYFITSRPRTKGFSSEMQSRLWLASIGVTVDHASVIATQADKKGVLASAMDLEVFLDDRPENIVQMMEEKIPVYCRRWQYNDDSDNFNYVDSLSEFLLNPEIGEY